MPLSGWWFVAPGAEPTARPAVVLLHGCGGIHDRQGQLARRYLDYVGLLHRQGMHALVLDSLTPRGEKELCTQTIGTRKVTQAQRRGDALAALRWLARQPGVDASRLGLLGWSNGGSTVLAATNETHRQVHGAEVHAAFAVAFYPGCTAELRRGYRTSTRVLLLLGASDDWTPAEPCERLARDAQGVAPQVVSYPGAFHGFDGTAPVRQRKDVPNGVRPGQGVTVGANAQAREQALLRLQEFLDGPR
ncbi:MAG: dienelactone hydrolase family protein [Variovorax sp.]|nr:dienelactone hydrolase family protein [Variovorax sp.]